MELAVEYDRGRLDAIRHSGLKLLQDMLNDEEDCDCVWGLRDSIWPARAVRDHRDTELKQARLNLIPLSRIGQMEGKSGSLVLIGVFSDPDNEKIADSHPLVVKTIPRDGGRQKLREEFDNALTIKPFVYDRKDVFTIPFRFDDSQEQYDILWSLFSASEPLWEGGKSEPRIRVRDLREPIEKHEESTGGILGQTLDVLKDLHRPFGEQRRMRRNVCAEYEWYLRSYRDVWGTELEEIWGSGATPVVKHEGSDRTNPLWVLEKLKGYEAELTIGAIHGDLHPGNVVLSTNDQPRIIDFGWSRDDSHIAKDFVLLECNLRFLLLNPLLPADQAKKLSRWLCWDADDADGLDTYCSKRAVLIKQLRKAAKQSFPEDANWTNEYLLPMFFVAFGLLRFALQLGSQVAAVETVLSLADIAKSDLKLSD